MITYDLAKRLKNAGFPHNWCLHTGVDGEKGDICIDHKGDVPTLSELIEACGDKFVNLTHFGALEQVMPINEKYNHTKWQAHGWKEAPNKFWVQGSNPEEAVALLYLELNKKV